MRRFSVYLLCVLCLSLQSCVLAQQLQHDTNAKIFQRGTIRGLTAAGRLPPGEHPAFAACLEQQYHEKYGTWLLIKPKDIKDKDFNKSWRFLATLFFRYVEINGWHSDIGYASYFASMRQNLAESNESRQDPYSPEEIDLAIQDFARIVFDVCGDALPKEDRCAALQAVELEPDWCKR